MPKIKTKDSSKTKTTLLEEILQNTDSEEDEVSGKISLTKSLLVSWEQKLLAGQLTQTLVKQLTSAFRAVVDKAGGEVPASNYQLDDSSAFNTVLRLCFTYFPSVWLKLAKLSDSKKKIGKNKWKFVKPLIKNYIFDIVKFLPEIQEQQVLSVVLKHLNQIIDFFTHFRQKSKVLLKVLITIWSTKSEQCKVLSFVCILKLVKNLQSELLDFALRRMYLTFVKNTTMVTPSSWPGIKFMQKSYAELCSLDLNMTYQQGFLYIRQLAIYLRNAIVSKKKDTVRAVYNWQYIHCLYLWSTVLNNLRTEDSLKPLVYPLIQIIIGCCRLMPTAKYIPLRLHCIRCLMILTENTEIYAPIPALIVEVLESVCFSKRPIRQNLKALDINCLLKLSKSQLEENNYKIAAIDQCCDLLVDNLQRFQTKPIFTELTFGIILSLKTFCKKCPVADLSRKVRLTVTKLQEHSAWMEEQKARSYLNLNDEHVLMEFEKRSGGHKNEQGPFEKYYEAYKKLKDREMMIKAAAVKLEVDSGKQKKKVKKEEPDSSDDDVMQPKKKIKKEEGYLSSSDEERDKKSKKKSKLTKEMKKQKIKKEEDDSSSSDEEKGKRSKKKSKPMKAKLKEIISKEGLFAPDVVTDFNLNDL